MTCQSCNHEIPGDSKWCPYCGNKPVEKSSSDLFMKAVAASGIIAAVLFLISGFVSLDTISECMKTNEYSSGDLLLVHVTWISIALAFFTLMLMAYLIYKITKSDK